MSKNEFLLELKRLLQRLPLEEQERALVYYEERFHEAGPENEARVLRELGLVTSDTNAGDGLVGV